MLHIDLWQHVSFGFLNRIFYLCKARVSGNKSHDLRTSGGKYVWALKILYNDKLHRHRYAQRFGQIWRAVSECPGGGGGGLIDPWLRTSCQKSKDVWLWMCVSNAVLMLAVICQSWFFFFSLSLIAIWPFRENKSYILWTKGLMSPPFIGIQQVKLMSCWYRTSGFCDRWPD